MTPSFRKSLMVAAALALSSPLAFSADGAVPAAKVERMVDAMVEMMPFGKVFDLLAADPTWPFAEEAEKVGPAKVACVRGELSSAGYRRYQAPRVNAYVAAHPERLDKDLALLEGGAASLFGKLVLAGAEGERTGVEVNPALLLAGATPAQVESFLAVFSDPANEDLRHLAGFGNSLDPQRSEEENEAAGEKIGGDIAGVLLRRAIDTCDVDLDSLN